MVGGEKNCSCSCVCGVSPSSSLPHPAPACLIYRVSVPDYTGGARVTRLRRQTDTDTRPEWTFCVPSFSPDLGSLDR